MIYHDRCDFDETDVENSTDLDQLNYWQLEVVKDIDRAATKLAYLASLPANERTKETGEDRIRTMKYKRLMGILHQKIIQRIPYVKKAQNAQEHTKVIAKQKEIAITLDSLFRQVAKENLTGKQYTEIIVEAKRRLSEQDPSVSF